MMKVKGLEDFGQWLRKGKISEANNQLGNWAINKGYAEFVSYVDDPDDKRLLSKKEMEKRRELFEKYNLPMKPQYNFTTVWELIKRLEDKKTKVEKRVIHVLLSEKSYNELIELDIKLFGKTDKPNYQEYLKQEEANPTVALFG